MNVQTKTLRQEWEELLDKAGDDWEDWDEQRLDALHLVGARTMPRLLSMLEDQVACSCNADAVLLSESSGPGWAEQHIQFKGEKECPRCHLIRELRDGIAEAINLPARDMYSPGEQSLN